MSDDHKHTTIVGYWGVFIGLMVLTGATYVAYKLHIENPALNIAVALAIAILKASLVLYFFMHLRESSTIVKATAVTGFVFLFVLLVFVCQDVLSRGVMPEIEPQPWPTTVLR